MTQKVKELSKKLVELAHQPKKLIQFIQTINLEMQDNRGYSMLHYMAEIGNHELILLLHKHQADPNVQDAHGQLPLHVATTRGHLKAVNTLIKITRNIDLQDRYGNSSLHLAAKHGDIIIVKALIKANALTNTINEDGSTPTALAEAYKHHAIAQHLIKNGGVKIMHILKAVYKAYTHSAIQYKILICAFSTLTIGLSLFATMKTNGELFPALIAAIGASLGITMICLEKPYRLVRMHERNQHNQL